MVSYNTHTTTPTYKCKSLSGMVKSWIRCTNTIWTYFYLKQTWSFYRRSWRPALVLYFAINWISPSLEAYHWVFYSRLPLVVQLLSEILRFYVKRVFSIHISIHRLMKWVKPHKTCLQQGSYLCNTRFNMLRWGVGFGYLTRLPVSKTCQKPVAGAHVVIAKYMNVISHLHVV